MNTKHLTAIVLASFAAINLSGCATAFNTSGSADYACPGMPMGVVCKTPAAVYKSTNAEIPDTDFDTPIGAKSTVEPGEDPYTRALQMSSSAAPAAKTSTMVVSKDIGPRPVRVPAQVVRIWIAPWVDKQDNLHLAEVQFAEIKPRTWAVGKPESMGSGGYVIPHLAMEAKAPGLPSALPISPKKAPQKAADVEVPAIEH